MIPTSSPLPSPAAVPSSAPRLGFLGVGRIGRHRLRALVDAGARVAGVYEPSGEAGAAVFCQKPLARTAAEARRVVEAARAADRLLGVDLSYRHVAGVAALRRLVQEGALGKLYAAGLVFHSAYGPDEAWFKGARLSGGGCVMDLGIHLVDLALWTLGFPEVSELAATRRAGGRPVRGRPWPGGASGGAGGERAPRTRSESPPGPQATLDRIYER